jgi:hypothetical protein
MADPEEKRIGEMILGLDFTALGMHLPQYLESQGTESMGEPTNDNRDTAARRRGRPKAGQRPVVPWEKVYELLVFGEVALQEATSRPDVQFPSYRELASRYGVSVSLIASYAAKHQCMKRRELVHAQMQLQFEQRLLEKRAEAPTMPLVEVIAIIDEYMRVLRQGAMVPAAQDVLPAHRVA